MPSRCAIARLQQRHYPPAAHASLPLMPQHHLPLRPAYLILPTAAHLTATTCTRTLYFAMPLYVCRAACGCVTYMLCRRGVGDRDGRGVTAAAHTYMPCRHHARMPPPLPYFFTRLPAFFFAFTRLCHTAHHAHLPCLLHFCCCHACHTPLCHTCYLFCLLRAHATIRAHSLACSSPARAHARAALLLLPHARLFACHPLFIFFFLHLRMLDRSGSSDGRLQLDLGRLPSPPLRLRIRWYFAIESTSGVQGMKARSG